MQGPVHSKLYSSCTVSKVIEVLTGLLVVITAFYAWVTFRILKANESVVSAMQAQNEALSRPYVNVRAFTEADNPILFLEILNTGKTAANHLRLSINKDFYQFGDRRPECNLANFNAFKHSIDCFPPDSRLAFYLAQATVLFGDKADQEATPVVFDVTAEYSFSGKTTKEVTTVDLRQFLQTRADSPRLIGFLKDIQKALEKIEKAIETLGKKDE